MPTKLICHTPDCVSCGADGTCKLDGEIRVDQKRCQSYTPHSIPFMEKPLALSELPKEEWVCHILEESGATSSVWRTSMSRTERRCAVTWSGASLMAAWDFRRVRPLPGAGRHPLPALRRGGQPGVRAVQNG